MIIRVILFAAVVIIFISLTFGLVKDLGENRKKIDKKMRNN